MPRQLDGTTPGGANEKTRTDSWATGTLSRRQAVVGAGAAVAGSGAGLSWLRNPTPVQAARRQSTPAAEFRPSLHSYPLVQEKKTLRVLIPHWGINWAENAFTQWYEDRTNVHIEWTVVEDEIALTQLNLQLASGDYPDIVMGFNWAPFELTPTTISAYGGQGLFVPLNDYLATSAPNYNTYVLPEYPIAEKLVTMPDGEIYSLPHVNDCYHCQFTTQKLWIQTAWLEQLGLTAATTLDEFEAVLRAFKDMDPNGNGSPDEIPLTSQTGWPLDGFFMSPFTPNPGKPWLYRDAGKVTAAYMQDGWIQGSNYLRRLLEGQLLSPDAFTQNEEQITGLGNNNRIGAAPGVVQGNFVRLTDGAAGLWSTFLLQAPLAGPDGTRRSFRRFNEANLGNVFVVTDKCEDPALAVAWADGLYEWETGLRATFGVPDVDWRWADGTELGIDGEPAKYSRIPGDPNAPEDASDNDAAWNQLGLLFRSNKDRLSEAVLNDPNTSAEVLLYRGCKEQLEPFGTTEDMDVLRPIFTPDEAIRVSELETVIAGYVEEQLALQVTGQVDAEAGRGDFLDQLSSLGIEEYLSIQQTAHDRMGA